MDDFYAARSRIIPPLPWSTFSPPFSVWAGLSRTLALWVIGALAIVQAYWQMRYFLHLSLRETPTDRLWLVAFALLVLALMVLGTLWVLFNLQHMVPMQMPE